jgi:O-antigen/teichoic acid export membrane protein
LNLQHFRLGGHSAPFLRQDTHTQEFLLGAGIALVLRGAGVLVALGFNFVLARVLGTDEAGIYFLANSVFVIAAVFGRLGLQKAIIRFVAANSALHDWQKVAGVFKQSVFITVFASLMSIAGIFLLVPYLAHQLYKEPRLIQPLWAIALALIPYNLALVYGDALQGLKKISKAMLINSVLLPLFQTVCVLLLVQWPTALGATLALIPASILTLFIGMYFWLTGTPQLKGVVSGFDMHDLIRTAWPMLGTSLIQIIIMQTSTIFGCLV